MGISSFISEPLRETIPNNEISKINSGSEITPSETVSFLSCPVTCCVGIVDIVNSTKITSRLTGEKIAKYYGIFLNTMGVIIKRYGGTLVKNIGDSILFYFPSQSSKAGHNHVLECGLTMTAYHDAISQKLQSIDLPRLDYRISLDYGTVVLANTSTSTCADIFGPTVNMCSKINHIAKPNGVVIGSDLHYVVKGSNYIFEQVHGCMIGLKNRYPVYAVSLPYNDTKKTVAAAIERTLLEISPEVFQMVINKLDRDFNTDLSDCRDSPAQLKSTLQDIFGVSHTAVLRSIVSKLEAYPYQRPVVDFIEKLH